ELDRMTVRNCSNIDGAGEYGSVSGGIDRMTEKFWELSRIMIELEELEEMYDIGSITVNVGIIVELDENCQNNSEIGVGGMTVK
ncbi:hypothetical protein SK128_026330, partial [Halocaridina rubra]